MTVPLLDLILERRSAATLADPPVTAEQIDVLVRAAATVPDHKRLRPYRFVLIEESGKADFGDALGAALAEARGAISDETREKVRRKAWAAPTQLVVIFSPNPTASIPIWEQKVTASCTGFAIVLAATSLGLGANWRSSPALDGVALAALLQLTPQEEILGWINLGGSAIMPANPRPPADVSALLTRLG